MHGEGFIERLKKLKLISQPPPTQLSAKELWPSLIAQLSMPRDVSLLYSSWTDAHITTWSMDLA